ncbi:universal stress protein [Desulforamulus aeronauticus]|uniref:Universal stress protein family protein n=1 Tax=Desulforamulus aeronauticus DSM 10349 TaxID=1121421 RepID=A0A1M6UN44_9FIRM|nr:universal stress protein [Desulforamulus aeronauticus]SHK70685.1 Universal stress protein family protein [Desulforamulus aeronauticus DSM 10349]
MYKNILIAVHGEEKENFTIELTEFIKLIKPNVTILHISETGLDHYGYVDQLASAITKDQFIQYIHDMANAKQKEVYDYFSKLTNTLEIKMEWKVRDGKPGDVIAGEIRQGSYDLLILGTKPKSPGNTSSKVKEKVIADGKTSLLIIK